MPQVSIIVPVYKAEKYFKRCIDSILNQTFSDYELILVDDGSPDNCPEICDKFAESDKRVKVIHKNNGGVSSARNAAIDIAKGEYLMFVDSDDYVENQILQYLYDKIVKADADFFLSGLVMEFTDINDNVVKSIKYGMPDKEYSVKELLESIRIDFEIICISGPWCKIYKKSIIDKCNIRFNTSLNLGEDTYFNLMYLDNCEKIITGSGIHYHYSRSNNESLFSRYNKYDYESIEFVYDKMRELYIKKKCSERSISQFEYNYIFSLIGSIKRDFINKDKNDYQYRICQIKKIISNKHIQKSLKHIKSKSKSDMLMLYLIRTKSCYSIYAILRIFYYFKNRPVEDI